MRRLGNYYVQPNLFPFFWLPSVVMLKRCKVEIFHCNQTIIILCVDVVIVVVVGGGVNKESNKKEIIRFHWRDIIKALTFYLSRNQNFRCVIVCLCVWLCVCVCVCLCVCLCVCVFVCVWERECVWMDPVRKMWVDIKEMNKNFNEKGKLVFWSKRGRERQ